MNSPIKIMISSSVYGFEDSIRQIAALLEAKGYIVISSLMGTITVHPHKSNLENCLLAVEECDIFLGFIRTYCGTGNIGDKNITFEEFRRAIELDKPYWFMVEHDVEFSRRLFSKGIAPIDNSVNNIWTIIQANKKIFDPLCIEMYNMVIKENKEITSRVGNWIQPYYCINDIRRYINTQFSDIEKVKILLETYKV